MISARQALATVEQTIMEARRVEARLERALREATEEAVRLRAERMSLFRELAKLKLDALTRSGVVQDLDAVERRALAMMAEGRRAAADYAGRRTRVDQELEAASAARQARAAELDEALRALGELRGKVEAETRARADWAAERARVDELGRMVEQADKKIAQADADREDKRKPYESDPLFMYLWGRRFGTADYAAGNLVRYLDRKVANLVGYDKARANYELLNAIPVQLREHVRRLGAELRERRTRLAAIEREALDKAGTRPLEARVRDLKAALDAADRRLVGARTELGRIEQEGRDGTASGEASYAQAIELLTSSDAAQDLAALSRKAAETPDPADDAILKRIAATETAIGRVEKETGEIRQETRELARRRSQIEHERDEFHRRGYDNPFGRLGNERVLASVLGGILGGVLQGTALRDVFNDGYRRQPGPWDSDFGRGPGGDDGFSTGGSIGGNGGFDTGGSFGGDDGPRTGGSF
jgi:chromosome segregation ATPase